MYFIKNGKKQKYSPGKTQSVERYREGAKPCKTWIFIVCGVIAALVAAWLIKCIIERKK